MSDKVIVDLTENLSNAGEPIRYEFEYRAESGLLPYPNATLKNVTVQFAVTYLKPNVKAEGTIVCDVDGYCDRCLANISRKFVLPFCQVFYKDGAGDGEYFYSGSKLDATKSVNDEIVLGLPSGLLCKPDCKGLCPKCGTNLNEAQCDCDKTPDNAFSVLKNLKF